MAATSDFQKQVAREVILQCAKLGITRFDAGTCERFTRARLRGKVVYGAGGVQWRAIRPLVKNNFEMKVRKARENLRQQHTAPKQALRQVPHYILEGARDNARFLEETLPERDRE